QGNLVTFTDVDSNIITYRLNADNLERNNFVLAGPIDDLAFTYYDGSGDETAVLGDVQAVEIVMTAADSEDQVDSLTFSSMVFMRSTLGSGASGEGYKFSKNADFSTDDTVFSDTDTFYIKVWTDEVDHTILDYAEYEFKKGKNRITESLTNNGDGTYTDSRSLSGYNSGTWTVNIDVMDNDGGRYKPTPAPTITIS
ncbi:MAG: hypothetical protein ABH869_08460, partial [Candidatus Omnitrophota bacterium]